ncbi:nuclease-related domain-containing protein [Frateuria aurantia]
MLWQHLDGIIILSLIVVALTVLKSPWAKGHGGEWWLRTAARLRLDRRIYHPLHDVTLPTPLGTTQIDHLFISVYGVFVVETKNMRGWILGQEHEARWTQQIYRKKISFQNPVRQNRGHCQALASLLGLRSDQVHSVVSFVGNSRFRTSMPDYVTHGAGFVRYIQSFRQPIFSPAEVDQLLQSIQRHRLPPGRATRRQHVRQLQARRLAKATSPPQSQALPIGQSCPRCGGTLLQRQRRRGPRRGERFIGCSGYPACRYQQPL